MQLSIIIPAYNEEKRLAPMMEAYVAHFVPRYGDDVELLVVVNGSTDGTEQEARAFEASHPQVRVIVEPRPVGKGGALLLGFAEASGEKIGFTDADGATPPRAFQDLVDELREPGAVIASRWLPASDVDPRQPLARRVASRIFNMMVRILFGLRITDTQCGAKIVTREALREVLPRLGVTRWAFDVDLLFQLRRAGYAIREIPTTWHDVRGSKLNVPKASVEMLLAITRLRLYYSPFRWVVSLYQYVGIRLKARRSPAARP
jgi:glycosyltransferase involved in cell wall biosynthesis